MSRRIAIIVYTLLISLTLSACWDSQLLTNKKIVNGISFDVEDKGQMLGSVRTIILESKGGGQFDVKDEFRQAVGTSTSIIGSKIDNMLPGTIEFSKTHIIIISDQLAKKGILPPLEPFFRNPRGYLMSHLLISRGKASQILGFKKIENNPVAFGIKQILDGAERATLVKDQTLYSVWSNVYDPGDDLIVPMVREINSSSLVVDGIALMHGSRYTGVSLTGEDATLLLLMSGMFGKLAILNIPEKQNLVTFQVRKIKQKLDVRVNKRTSAVECKVKLDLYGSIQSDPSKLGSSHDTEQLRKELSAAANEQAAAVISQMLQANSDALGIGRKVSVRYPRLWKKMNWNDMYKDTTVKPEIRIHIRSTGIIG